MCCAIRKTCRSYLRTNVSYADTSPARTLSTRAMSGCCSFSPAIGWMVAMGVSCGKSTGYPGAVRPVGDISSVTDGGEGNQTATFYQQVLRGISPRMTSDRYATG